MNCKFGVVLYKKRLFNYLRSKGHNPVKEKFIPMYCSNCGFQRIHKYMDCKKVKLAGKTVFIGFYRCEYCFERGVKFVEKFDKPIY